MNKDNVIILSQLQVEQKLQRIARQIVELHYNKKEIIIIGITNRGLKIANKIYEILKSITDIELCLCSLSLDKDNPLTKKIELIPSDIKLDNKSVILIDDVLNSGKTLIYATSYLLKNNIKQLNTVVLVDRMHRMFPIRADFVGLTLSTTLKEHIAVKEISKSKFEVYLD